MLCIYLPRSEFGSLILFEFALSTYVYNIRIVLQQILIHLGLNLRVSLID